MPFYILSFRRVQFKFRKSIIVLIVLYQPFINGVYNQVIYSHIFVYGFYDIKDKTIEHGCRNFFLAICAIRESTVPPKLNLDILG